MFRLVDSSFLTRCWYWFADLYHAPEPLLPEDVWQYIRQILLRLCYSEQWHSLCQIAWRNQMLLAPPLDGSVEIAQHYNVGFALEIDKLEWNSNGQLYGASIKCLHLHRKNTLLEWKLYTDESDWFVFDQRLASDKDFLLSPFLFKSWSCFNLPVIGDAKCVLNETTASNVLQAISEWKLSRRHTRLTFQNSPFLK